MTIGYHLYKSRLLVRVKQRRLWVRILAAGCARVMFHLHPPDRQRAQGKPGARCTRGLACICAQKARTRAYRSSGEHPAFPAQWFTAYFALSPVNGFIATVTAWISRSIRCAPRSLTPAPRRQDRLRRTRHAPSSCAHSASTASHRNVRDDRDPPLSRVRRAELCR